MNTNHSAKRLEVTVGKRPTLIMVTIVILISNVAIAVFANGRNPFNDTIASEVSLGGELYYVSTLVTYGAILALLACILVLFRQLRGSKEQSEIDQLIQGHLSAINAHSLVAAISSKGVLIYVNTKFLETMGYSEGELLGSNIEVIYPENPDDPVRQEIAAAIAAEKPWEGKQRLQKKNGEVVVTLSTIIPVRDPRSNTTNTIFLHSDITELEVEESTQMMSALLGELQDEVYVYDTESLKMIYANKSACERCDWLPSETETKRILDSSKNFDEIAFKRYVSPLWKKDRISVVIEVQHEKGWVEISTRLFETPSGSIAYLSVLRDLSSRHKIEKARMDSIAEISHELRTPLTSIKGSLNLVESGAIKDVPEKAVDLLKIASRNTERLLSLVNGILDLQKLRSGSFKCEKKTLELGLLLEEAMESTEGYCSELNVEMEVEYRVVDARIVGDRERLIQVVTNLISNAAKYSPEGDKIKLTLSEQDDLWRLTVRDNGPGIPQEAHHKVFESFGQVTPPDGVKREGTGLGLAISAKIVRIHEGRLSFDSAVGEGTEFHLELPKLMSTGARSILHS